MWLETVSAFAGIGPRHTGAKHFKWQEAWEVDSGVEDMRSRLGEKVCGLKGLLGEQEEAGARGARASHHAASTLSL